MGLKKNKTYTQNYIAVGGNQCKRSIVAHVMLGSSRSRLQRRRTYSQAGLNTCGAVFFLFSFKRMETSLKVGVFQAIGAGTGGNSNPVSMLCVVRKLVAPFGDLRALPCGAGPRDGYLTR